MAERAGIRLSFFDPAQDSVENRSRRMNCASGTSAAIAGRMVALPRNSVSCRPRMFSRRSVKTWPRSGSAQSWISSMATKSASTSGMASVVATQ